MFSSRLHWDLQTSPIAQLIAAKKAAGVPILDLTESNPTAAQLDYPVEQITTAFADPDILRYEPNPAGLRSAREAVAAYYGDADPDRILLTTSTSEAYGYLFKLLTNPGDDVLVPRPSYPLFEFLAGMELVKTTPYPLVYHGRWEIDFDELREAATDRTKAIVLVNPNNPTGSFLHAGEFDPLISFCRDRGLAIISDEVFSDYGFGSDPARVNSLRHTEGVPAFCLSGLSKIAGLPQMKLGWILLNSLEPLSRLELIADTYLSVGTPVQRAAPRLLEVGRSIRAQIAARTARNLDVLRAAIGPESPLRLLHVEGGWYAILQVPRLLTEEQWVLELLERENVLVQPGFFYDFESEAYLIVSLLTPTEVFDAGLERLTTAHPIRSRER